MAERWGLCPDHEPVVDPITGRASATCQCRPVTAPDPTLADAIDGWAEADESNKLLYSFVSSATTLSKRAADLRVAAVRLREQDAEIENLKAANALAVGHLVHVDDLPELTRPPHPHSAGLFMAGMLAQQERDDARLRKLDRIEAALGDVWTANEIRWAVGDGRVVKMAYHPLDEMLRRLADALEAP